MQKRILVCEDESSIRKLLEYNLKKNNYYVKSVDSGEKVDDILHEDNFDLILLDLMLPGLDGFEVAKLVKVKFDIPIIILSAKDDEIDKVLGLELGADDYVTKPFSMRELLARVKAVLRRSEKSNLNKAQGIYKAGSLEVDSSSRKAFINSKEIELTALDFDLLCYLIRNRGAALHRNDILDEVWGTEFVGDSRMIDVHISHIRDKLSLEGTMDGFIETVRGIGYRMK